MIQDHPYPALPRRGRRSRQQVVRTGAQYARYFLLGLAVVSLFVGLNVSLAGRTAELAVSIKKVEKECRRLEWDNAEKVSRISLETNMEEVQSFAQQRGFASPRNVVYVAHARTIASDPSPTALGVSATSSPSTAPQAPGESSRWRAAVQRLRGLVPSPGRQEHIAAAR